MIKERRRFPRTFVFWRAELTLEGQNTPTSLHATEVSDIGIGLVGDSALPVGATCTLTLEMEDWQGLPQSERQTASALSCAHLIPVRR